MPSLIDRLRHKLVPAVPVPFDAAGMIDSFATRRYSAWMAGQDVGAVALWAHTGRGLLLSDEYRAHTLELWREALDEIPIICGVGAPASEQLPDDPRSRTDRVIELSVSLATSARIGGATGALLYPPTQLRDLADRDRRVVELHQAVAKTGLPVLAFYLYEQAGGISYALDTIDQLLDIDGVIGIKLATLDSVMTFQDLAARVAQHDEVLLVTGEDRFLGYSLMLGADAALVGMAAACTDICAGLLGAWFQRDLPRFAELTLALDRFASATFRRPMDGYVQRMMWALEADDVIPNSARDPFGPELSETDRTAVFDAVRALRHR
jgi:4-hydroxy-tetrahydrodipicolinate synthase